MSDNHLKLIELPASDEIAIDLMDPGRSTIAGAFRQSWMCGDVERSMVTYMPKNWYHNNRCIITAPPSGADVLEFLEKSGLRAFSDESKVLVCVLEARNHAWDFGGTDCDFMNAAYKKVQGREYYNVMQDCIYAMGFGDGTNIAQQAAMRMASEWSGLATFGTPSEAIFSLSLDQQDADSGKQTDEMFISGKRAQLPVWMVVQEKTDVTARLADYWRGENNDTNEPLFDAHGTEVYLPRPLKRTSKINDDNIAQVRLTIANENEYPGKELLDYVWSYTGAARRHRSYGCKVLRYYREPTANGATYHTMVVDGMLREWYEYVPARYQDSNEPVPLVVVFHGRGSNGETFFDVTDMALVAEERGFIAAFPTADIYQIRKGGFRGIRLWNGDYMGKATDSLPFVRKMVEDICSRHNIDAGRIFACGQSSGGHMASCCALRASDVFCAAAPWSGMTFPGAKLMQLRGEVNLENGKPPLYILVGKKDAFFGVNSLTPIPEDTELGKFLLYILGQYGLEDAPARYCSYPIDYYVWNNREGVPLLTVGLIDDLPHANYAEESRITYDEFFAKFSKDEQGNRYYMGKKVG
ncbi:MAG: hypothetical protein ENTB_01880 [Enterocloster aldenensis]